MQLKQNPKDSIDPLPSKEGQKMKISLFIKPSIMKVCSIFILFSFITSTPLQVNAGFFDFITGGSSEVLAYEFGTDDFSDNSQTMALLEASVPDMKNIKDDHVFVLVEEDSLLSVSGAVGHGLESVSSSGIMIYTVKEGDTLSQIAEDFDISQNTIRWENDISGGNIRIGQKLSILPVTGVKHTVKNGDTLGGIAKKYDAEIEDLKIFNDKLSDSVIKIGDVLIVPNGTPVSVDVVKKSTSTSSSSSVSAKTISSGYYMRPTSGIITSPYGPRWGSFHYGIDIGNKRGTPVVAAATGKVIKTVSYCKEGVTSCGGRYGNYIVIEHDNGQRTTYAHLQKVSVSVGQTISKGKTIGTIGNTGRSTGPHLHFQVERSNGSTIKPVF